MGIFSPGDMMAILHRIHSYSWVIHVLLNHHNPHANESCQLIEIYKNAAFLRLTLIFL